VKLCTQALVFDAYGTLFDVHSVIALCDRKFPRQGAELSKLWRTKQLEYTWLRSLVGRYEDFWTVLRSAVEYGILVKNPVEGVKVPKDKGSRSRTKPHISPG